MPAVIHPTVRRVPLVTLPRVYRGEIDPAVTDLVATVFERVINAANAEEGRRRSSSGGAGAGRRGSLGGQRSRSGSAGAGGFVGIGGGSSSSKVIKGCRVTLGAAGSGVNSGSSAASGGLSSAASSDVKKDQAAGKGGCRQQ